MTSKSAATDAFFASYADAAAIAAATPYDVVAFGDSAAMATELALLVRDGPKRATAGLFRDFESSAEPLPIVGGHVVVVDGEGTPICIWRTTEVTVKPFREVDAAFAWDEGEGDRTLADWLAGHREFFNRQAATAGFTFDEGMQTVFERFKLVWPVADRSAA